MCMSADNAKELIDNFGNCYIAILPSHAKIGEHSANKPTIYITLNELIALLKEASKE